MSADELYRILPLPEEELNQILKYAGSLPVAESAAHLRALLGDEPAAVEFIVNFNSRKGPDPVASRKKKKQVAARQSLHTPAPRPIVSAPVAGTAYLKSARSDAYIPARPGPMAAASVWTSTAPGPSVPAPKPAVWTATPLVGTTGVRSGAAAATKPPAKAGKAATTGGRNNAGSDPVIIGALADLDAAIRALERSTNPKLTSGPQAIAARRCGCMARRHALQTVAPNCLRCGKIVCVREGLGPCTSCGEPLMSAAELQGVVQELRAERGREKMAADRDKHRRTEAAGKRGGGAGYARAAGGDVMGAAAAAAAAAAHRDTLLRNQAQHEQRTAIHDEAADCDVAAAAAGQVSAWATPRERARALRAQQRLLRETERRARPEHERRRRTVLSLGIIGGKVIRQFAAASPSPSPSPPSSDTEGDDDRGDGRIKKGKGPGGGGTGLKNPLRGRLVKPVYKVASGAEGRPQAAASEWRRVQNDDDENV